MSFKRFDLSTDVNSQVSYVNEVVSVSGSIYSNEQNTKRYNNIASSSTDPILGGYFQSFYDASPTSSLSTPLFDATYGFATGSSYNVQVTTFSSLNEKIKIYRHMAQVLLGDKDSVFNINSTDAKECFFLCIKRNIQKDEIKKGSVALTINTANVGRPQYSASDEGAVTAFKQSIGGDYAPLKSGSVEVGQIWYNSGIVVLPTSLVWSEPHPAFSGSTTLINVQYSGTIDNCVDGLKRKIEKVDFHNQTNLHSTQYFCRATNSEFNYSSNPTFVDANQRIRVTSGSNILQTRTYVTTIGLYDSNDNLLAVAKVNKPIAKSPESECTFRVRLDY